MALSENIAESRKANGMTQEELAAAIGVSQGAVSQFERGVKTPGVGTLEQIADALHCSVDHLLGRKV